MPTNPTGRPPARQGVVATKIILDTVVPQGEFFAARAGDSPFVPGTLLTPGTALSHPTPAWTFPDTSHERPIPFAHTVLFEDEHILVADKPHFLPTTPNGRLIRETLQTRLRASHGESITVAHRLDRLTAGLVLAVKNPAERGAYQELFASQGVRKTYLARTLHPAPHTPRLTKVTLGMRKVGRRVVVDKHGTVTQTRWRTLDSDDLLELHPATGHTHQLRVVAAHLAGGIVGDDLYPCEKDLDLYDFRQPLHLLAARIEFTDPLTGQAREFVSQQGLPTKISGRPSEQQVKDTGSGINAGAGGDTEC